MIRLRTCLPGLLLIAVGGAGNAAGEAGGLDKARTVDAVAGIAAPQIGRAQEGRSHRNRVGSAGCHRTQMVGDGKFAAIEAQEAALLPHHCQLRAK